MVNIRVLGFIECEDYNEDSLEILEGLAFNTKVLNLKSKNNEVVTETYLDQEKARELGKLLISWADGEL